MDSLKFKLYPMYAKVKKSQNSEGCEEYTVKIKYDVEHREKGV
jgi:hypothetical protein